MRALRSRDLLAALTVVVAAAAPVRAQQTPGAGAQETPPVTFAFDDHPSIRFGDVARIDGLAKFQSDWRHFDSAAASDGGWTVQMARLGVAGQFFKVVEYEVERDLHDDSNPWRDVYVEVNALQAAQARAGKFKVPFSLEMLTGPMDLDFVGRSLAASSLAPGRGVGAKVHGRVLSRIVRYDIGMFRDGGDNVRQSERTSPDGGPMVAARVEVSPWREIKKSRLRTLTFGGGVTTGHLPEGLNSLNVRTASGEPLAPRVYVNGSRHRLGGDVEWRNGPFGLRAEVMAVRDQRLGEGTDDNDLPSVRADGGYVSGTWLVTGEKKSSTVRPLRPAPHRGAGAVEVAARIEWIATGTTGTGTPSAGPRAEHLVSQESRVLTFGANWYLNRFIRLQANVLGEHRLEGGSTVPGKQVTWSSVIRVLFRV